jgi:hypothetical protein
VLEELLIVAGGFGVLPTSDQFLSMSTIGLHAAKKAVLKTEERYSKLIGFHLGTLLSKDILAAMFLQPEGEEETQQDPSSEPVPGSSTLEESYIPLGLILKPEFRNFLRRRAIEMSPPAPISEKSSEIPGLDPDRALMEHLQAVARAAEARRAKKEEAEKAAQEEALDRAAGIQGHIRV